MNEQTRQAFRAYVATDLRDATVDYVDASYRVQQASAELELAKAQMDKALDRLERIKREHPEQVALWEAFNQQMKQEKTESPS